jgi:uncharacterized protein
MKSVKHKFILVLAIISCSLVFDANAQNIPARPSPPRLVNDFAKMLSNEENNFLEQKLVAYFDSTSTQLAVVTIETLEGSPVQEYAAQLGYKWGVGTKENHNGVVLLISKNDRKGFIATGYGVEDGLNTNVCQQIFDTYVVPNMKSGNTFKAIDDATSIMIQVLDGKFQMSEKSDEDLSLLPLIIIVLFIIFIFYVSSRSKNTSISQRGYVDSSPPWFGGGGWGSGSSGGGGFGGFGGGDFSGGGAGGSW